MKFSFLSKTRLYVYKERSVYVQAHILDVCIHCVLNCICKGLRLDNRVSMVSYVMYVKRLAFLNKVRGFGCMCYVGFLYLCHNPSKVRVLNGKKCHILAVFCQR